MSLLKKKSDSTVVNQPPKSISQAPSILLRPVVSEKASRLQQLGQYTFALRSNLTKIDVKKAIEATYGVKVIGVNLRNLPRKTLRRGRIIGQTRVRRQVVVRLAKGQSLELTKSV